LEFQRREYVTAGHVDEGFPSPDKADGRSGDTDDGGPGEAELRFLGNENSPG